MSDTKPRPQMTGNRLFIILPLALLLVACGEKYSPDTYKSSAVQQASKVESGVVIGVRKVAIQADPTIASATGAAAGGIAGSQVSEGAYSALSALGGAVVGGIAGSEAGHKLQDTFGYEYIVRNSKGDLLSVTQKDATPLKVGQRVLLIQGSQARVVNDYTEHVEPDVAAADRTDAAKDKGTSVDQPAPAAPSETEKLMNAAAAAAAAAAVAAITAESMKDKDKDKDKGAAVTPDAAPDAAATAATTATPAPTDATPDEAEATMTSESDETPDNKEAAASAPLATSAPLAISPTLEKKATPAPPSTIIVAEPTQITKPGTATTSPSTAPATGSGALPTKVTVAKEAEAKDKAEASSEDEDEAKSKPEADDKKNEATTAPAKQQGQSAAP